MAIHTTSKTIARLFPMADLSGLPTSNQGGGKVWNNAGFLSIGAASAPAADSAVVHIAGAETITGNKKFNGNTVIPTLLLTDATSGPQLFSDSSSDVTIFGVGGRAAAFLPASVRLPSASVLGWSSTLDTRDTADTKIKRYATGPAVELNAAGGLRVRDLAGTAAAPITAGASTFSGNVVISGSDKHIAGPNIFDGAISFDFAGFGMVGFKRYAGATTGSIYIAAAGGGTGGGASGGMQVSSAGGYNFTTGTNAVTGASTTGIWQSAAGVLEINKGALVSLGGSYGKLTSSDIGIGASPVGYSGWNGRVLHIYDTGTSLPHVHLQSLSFNGLFGQDNGSLYLGTDSQSIKFDIQGSQRRFLIGTAQQFKHQVYDSSLAAWQETMREEASPSGGKWGVFGNAALQQTGGVATAGAAYGATEQSMLQTLWDAMRTFGFLN